MKKILILLGVATVGLIAYAGYAWWKESFYRDGEAKVRAMLKDPESARFSDTHYNDQNKVFCGMVNAKNSMGGYAGSRPFMVAADGQVSFFPSEDPDLARDAGEKLARLNAQLAFYETLRRECGIEKKKA